MKLSRRNKIGIVSLVAVLVFGAAAYAVAPMFWGLAFSFYLHPVGWLLFIGGVLTIGWSIKSSIKKVSRPYYVNSITQMVSLKWVGVIVIVAFVWIGYAVFAYAYSQVRIAQDAQINPMTTLTDTHLVRPLPLEVAETYGRNAFQKSNLTLGDFEPMDISGQLKWVSPQVPNGFINSFKGHQDGFVIINTDGSTQVIDQPMKCGDGMELRDSLSWVLHRKDMWAELTDDYYVQDSQGQVLAVVPYLSYHMEFPVMVPKWGGVFVVDPSCHIDQLSTKQAQQDPRLAGQRIYPLAMARKIAHAWGYRHGILNAWFSHTDQVQVPNLTDSPNQMPFLIPTASGPAWFTAFEPHGKSYGISKIQYIDARTGKISQWQTSESSLLGPSRAIGYVKSAYANENWENADGTSGTVIAIEPRPVIHGGVLYWMISVTNRSYSGVAWTAMVDTVNDSVTRIDDLNQVQAFVDGTLQTTSVSPNQTAQGSQPTVSSVSSPQSGTQDVSKMTDQQLLQLQQQIISEQEKRLNK